MSSAKITLLGQYNYDNTLFDGLTFPAGINKQTAVDEILLKAADFEVLYSDISFNKQAIIHWGVKNFRTFEQWVKALAIEFDPLYNYDRFEEYTDEKLSQGSTKNVSSNEAINNEVVNNSESSKNSDNGKSVTQTSTDSTSTDTDTRSVSAYDAATYQPREQEVKDNTSGQTGNGMAVNENSSEAESSSNNVRNATSSENGSNDTTSNNTEQIKHTAHLYGNIGVTTSTQMLEDFLRVERFNIYEQLADMFISELCLLIY